MLMNLRTLAEMHRESGRFWAASRIFWAIGRFLDDFVPKHSV